MLPIEVHRRDSGMHDDCARENEADTENGRRTNGRPALTAPAGIRDRLAGKQKGIDHCPYVINEGDEIDDEEAGQESRVGRRTEKGAPEEKEYQQERTDDRQGRNRNDRSATPLTGRGLAQAREQGR